MPGLFCSCTGCAACGAHPGRAHAALFTRDSAGAGSTKCPPCRAAWRKRKNNDRPGRPSSTARGYGADWRRISARLIAAATVCAHCGRPPVPGDPFTVDHIVPRAHGGTDDEHNLRVIHRSENSARGGRTRRAS